MATVLKRQESRRRLAAITFLSNISLDGTHRDTKLAPFVINANRELNHLDSNNTDLTNTLVSSSLSPDQQQDHQYQHKQNLVAFYQIKKSNQQQASQLDFCSPQQSTAVDRHLGKSSGTGSSGDSFSSTAFNSGHPDENGGPINGSPTQSRRQSCSLPLGQHCSSKDTRSPVDSNDGVIPLAPDVRARLSSFGSYKRNRHNLPSSSLVNHPLNSCESIVSIGIQQSFIRSRNGSVNRSGELPQATGKSTTDQRHQVRFLPSSREQSIQNERIVLVTSKRAPVALLSYIPYSRKSNYATNREIKQDLLNKRRHATGNRQLSTITDGPDPTDLLWLPGMEKPLDGLEVSYSNLLSPSFRPGLTKKAKVIYSSQEQHNFVSRCISYDSAVSYPTKPQIGSSHYLLHQMTAPPMLNDNGTNLIRDKHQYHAYYNPTYLKYNPDILDDPELIAGKHSTLLDFPSYLTSIINYVKPSDLKKELNEKFKERFPYIQLTLSKMRSLKRDMCKIAKHEGNIDYLTVAQAYVYFEKLILKLLINKQNRKLCAGACLLLSAKLNDVKGAELKKLIERIENTFRVDRKDLFAIEFSVLVALEFGLHLPINETLSHYQRLMYET